MAHSDVEDDPRLFRSGPDWLSDNRHQRLRVASESDAEILREIALTNQPGEGEMVMEDDDDLHLIIEPGMVMWKGRDGVIHTAEPKGKEEWNRWYAEREAEEAEAGPGLDGLDLGGEW